MSEKYNAPGPTTFECVDKDPESARGSGLDDASVCGVTLNPVEPFSSGLGNSRYLDEKELTCVVCTR